MGAHKGRKWADKPSVQRYFAENRRLENKKRRILRNNGQAFLDKWMLQLAKGR